jgi:hypothetical protein
MLLGGLATGCCAIGVDGRLETEAAGSETAGAPVDAELELKNLGACSAAIAKTATVTIEPIAMYNPRLLPAD